MTMNFPKYPEVALWPRRPEIFAVKQVIATEKLHGSNFRVGFPAGMADLSEVRFGSRETEFGVGEEKFPLGVAVLWFQSRPDLLTTMWEVIKSYGFSDVTIFGEAFGPGIKTKGVKYSAGSDMLFRAFDIMVGDNFVTYDLFVEMADKMGLPRVPEVWRGDPTLEAFDALLERTSTVAQSNGLEDTAEGVVIRSNPLMRNVFGEWLIVKHKSSKFSEVAHAPKVATVKGPSPAADFVEGRVTTGRVRNALGRLRDRGVVLAGTMVDMPVVITEIVADLIKEHGPEIAELGIPEGDVEKTLKGPVAKKVGPSLKALILNGEV